MVVSTPILIMESSDDVLLGRCTRAVYGTHRVERTVMTASYLRQILPERKGIQSFCIVLSTVKANSVLKTGFS